MANDLDFLVEKEDVETFFNANSKRLFDSDDNIQVINIKRAETYNPDSYNVWYKITIGEKELELRASASKELAKKPEFDLLSYLYFNGFERGNIQVAKPLYFFEELNLFFYEHVKGHFFADDLKNNFEELKEKIRLCAIALKKFHNLKKPDLKLWDPSNFFSVNYYEKSHLEKYYPEFGSRVDDILNKLKEDINPTNDIFCHGDYHPMNLVIDNNKLFILDLGLSCFFDKEYDVASFVNQLRVMIKRFGNYDWYNELKNIFLEEYGAKKEEKYRLYSILNNIRILITFCITQKNTDNKEYMEMVLSQIEKDLNEI